MSSERMITKTPINNCVLKLFPLIDLKVKKQNNFFLNG